MITNAENKNSPPRFPAAGCFVSMRKRTSALGGSCRQTLVSLGKRLIRSRSASETSHSSVSSGVSSIVHEPNVATRAPALGFTGKPLICVRVGLTWSRCVMSSGTRSSARTVSAIENHLIGPPSHTVPSGASVGGWGAVASCSPYRRSLILNITSEGNNRFKSSGRFLMSSAEMKSVTESDALFSADNLTAPSATFCPDCTEDTVTHA